MSRSPVVSLFVLGVAFLALTPPPTMAVRSAGGLPPADEEPPSPVISAENYTSLAQATQLGNGLILALAFAPDGRSFVVGSMWGLARFSADDPAAPPVWIPFDAPVFYYDLQYSRDGAYLFLERSIGGQKGPQVRRASDGKLLADRTLISSVDWLPSAPFMGYGRPDKIASPDGRLLFQSVVDYLPENFEIEVSSRYILQASPRRVLLQLPDETFYKYYHQMREPEGCDIRAFAPDANAFYPQAYTPDRAAFSPSGRALAVLYSYGRSEHDVVRVYDTATGEIIGRLGSLAHGVESFAFSPTEDVVAVGFVDGTVLLWDLANGDRQAVGWRFTRPAYDFQFLPDSRHLVVHKPDAIEVVSPDDGTRLREYAGTAYALSPSGDRLAVGGADGSIRIVDPLTGALRQLIPAHGAKVYALAFSPDGNTLASSGRDCAVRAWNLRTGEYWHPFEENASDPGFGRSRLLTWYLTFSPAGDRLLGLGSWGRVAGWDTRSGATAFLVEPEPLEYYNGMITAKPHFPMDFAPQPEGTFYLGGMQYDAGTGQRIGEYVAPEGMPVDCTANGPITRDGKLRFTIGLESRGGQICVFDNVGHALLGTITVMDDSAARFAPIRWLDLSPDGTRLVVNLSEGAILVYQVAP